MPPAGRPVQPAEVQPEPTEPAEPIEPVEPANTVGPPRPPHTPEADLVRQGERTVDNLKRLFAFVFSLSFAIIGLGAINKLKDVFLAKSLPSLSTWLLDAEMLTVFVITAGVFYHQSAKYLDNRYARAPSATVGPFGFAGDYIRQVLTAVPFYFMAFAFGPDVTHAVGYFWFFGVYLILLASGLILLFPTTFEHATPVAPLHIYWFLMNSAILLIILALFQGFVWTGYVCPTSPMKWKCTGFPLYIWSFRAVE
jgi:hypothetical protein